MAFVRSGAEFGNILRLPTETEKLLELWQFSHNWRETVPPQANTPEALGWIPRAQRDVLQESIEVLSREPAHPDFLRPPGGSKLATEGAGNEIEELPPYVGAIPPPEVPPWNWQRTWDARHKYLFTVSQQEAVGGEFRSLNAALARARPNSTIRVLDDAVYHETLAINSPTRHAGVTLETANGATVQAELQNANLVQVAAVPNVTLRGFKLRAPGGLACIVTKNNCPGLTLERLHCGGSQIGIEVIHNSPGRDGLPIVIKNCEFEQMAGGVRLIGAEPYSVPIVNSRIVVCDNTFRACHFAITIMGDSRDILVAGNRVLQAAGSGIQLENLVGEPERILIANNTLFECGCSVRLWDNVARGKQIELRNNLSLAPLVVDMAWSDNGGTRDTTAGPGEGAALSWQMDCNWREGKQPADPMLSKAWIPPAPNDELHDAIPGLSRDASSPDFLRPRVNSPLATKGAGRIDKSLPEYVGAVPPDGKPWNWDVTWQERSGTHAKRSPP
jgi:hypothetical protein